MPASPARTALSATQVIAKLAHLDGWKLFGDGDHVAIEKTFQFPGYLQTMAFANAVAFIAEAQQHHPELLIHHQRCSVRWNTHDVQGISADDFACAAKVDALFTTD
jgi:4a-hydroxytetrahydrobiopterin dehydratase